MVVQSKHLQKALNGLSAAHQRVAGPEKQVEDREISLAILDRALADALHTRVELLEFVDSRHIAELAPELKAQAGRVFAVRSILFFELGRRDSAALSARLAVQAFHETLEMEFDDEDRYVANYLHQFLTRDVITICFHPPEVGRFYEALFSFYLDQEHFDRAEDVLFHALDLLEEPLPLLQRGLAFYEELAAMDTRWLQKRGLPRHEVNESRRELEARLQSLQA